MHNRYMHTYLDADPAAPGKETTDKRTRQCKARAARKIYKKLNYCLETARRESHAAKDC